MLEVKAVYKKPLWDQLPALHPEDIALETPTPLWSRGGRRARGSHKLHQLCRQAWIAVEDALASDPEEPLLLELWVEAVEPAPDARRLRVLLRAPEEMDDVMEDIRECLEDATAWIRREVSSQIHRRRAPELDLVLLAHDEVRRAG
jgi:ribosome-binding factor A